MIDVSVKVKPYRILDFDIETVAAGFADPQWVPQRVTAIAWSWVGKRDIEVRTRRDMFAMFMDFLAAYEQADMVTGHNLIRFDLPVLNADLIRSGYSPLEGKLVQDTMRLVKTKGLKKGQDNLSLMTGVRYRKLPLDWQAWDNAYQWDDLIEGGDVEWTVVEKRVVGDVRQHKQLRTALLGEGLLKPPVRWEP